MQIADQVEINTSPSLQYAIQGRRIVWTVHTPLGWVPMGDWESIFRKEGRHFLAPHEDMANIIRLFRTERVRNVLDIGCGSGRHTVLLAQRGFHVTGMDVSPEGLRLTRQWLREKKVAARLTRRDFFEPFPFGDAVFDGAIAIQTIHHGLHGKIRGCIGEIARVLKPGGIVFVSVTRTSFRRWASAFKAVAPRTFVPLDGPEAGVPHYVYTRAQLRKDFAGFTIIDLHADARGHLCLLGRRLRSLDTQHSLPNGNRGRKSRTLTKL